MSVAEAEQQASPFTALAALDVRCYRRAPAATGWYRKGAWARQYRLYAAGCWTWADWWRRADRLPVDPLAPYEPSPWACQVLPHG